MKFRRRLSPNVNLNLVPMIDIVFQLIIFFMVATTLSISPGIPIALPASTTAEQVVMTKLVVTVVSEDEIYLNREKYTLAGLAAALAQIPVAGNDEAKGAIIEGDSGVSYSLMVRVLDALRQNGYTAANLKTKPMDRGSQ